MPNGIELRVLRNGALLWSQVFPSGEEALAEAEAEKQRMLKTGLGWTTE